MQFGFGKKNKDVQINKSKEKRFCLEWGKCFKLECQNTKCICPACGLSVPHQKRVQCFKLKCPQCGSTMTRILDE
ncbi:MAG: hypothetical protein HQK79_17680 [Desulfobacterales bacterium]|nr:hypothetical protein [Desulfobacterales bacterium]MBF0398898.1 hypothetical protein [Desulfobacterales bacterium]